MFFPNPRHPRRDNFARKFSSAVRRRRLRTHRIAGTRIAKETAQLRLIMKNSLTTLALVLAAATPAAFIIELAGTALPAIVDSAHLFGAFMLTFLLKIM